MYDKETEAKLAMLGPDLRARMETRLQSIIVVGLCKHYMHQVIGALVYTAETHPDEECRQFAAKHADDISRQIDSQGLTGL